MKNHVKFEHTRYRVYLVSWILNFPMFVNVNSHLVRTLPLKLVKCRSWDMFSINSFPCRVLSLIILKRFIFGRLFSSFVLLNFVDDCFRRSKWTQIWPSFDTLDLLSGSEMVSYQNDINLPNFVPNFRIFEISNHPCNQRVRFNKVLEFLFRNGLDLLWP